MREKDDEWRIIETLLPEGWAEKATELKAVQRTRELTASQLLRLLLFHVVNNAGTRATATQAAASGIANVSGEALRRRLLTAGDWLGWIASRLSSEFREQVPAVSPFRPRAVDSSTIQGPGAKGTDYRLHYSVDLVSLQCDWHEVSDVHGAELIERTPVAPNDVLIADRNYFRATGVRSVVNAGGHVLLRLRAQHPAVTDPNGQPFLVRDHLHEVHVGEAREWRVGIQGADAGTVIEGRIIATRLPAPIAKRNEEKVRRMASRKQHKIRATTILASHYFMVFTTIPAELLEKTKVLDLYRFRWQIEVAFKRLKQILTIGRLPYKDARAARAWIHAKLVVALTLEKIYRQARAFSPWGYDLQLLNG